MECFSCDLTKEVEEIKVVNERKNKSIKRKEMLLEIVFVSGLFFTLYLVGSFFIR